MIILSSAMVIFRELFEITLIVSMIFAVTKGVVNRNLYIFSGISLGALFSAFFAYSLQYITDSFDGNGQEIMRIVLLSVTVIFIAINVIWLSKNSASFGKNLKTLSADNSLYMMAIMICSAVIREGTEIILFIQSIYIISNNYQEILKGAAIGAMLAFAVGFVLYNGLLRFSFKYIFKITTFLLILFAAAISSQVASLLEAADILSFYNDPLWDSSSILREDSLVGKVIATIFGYDPKPTGLEAIFYLLTFVMIYLLSVDAKKEN